MSADHDESSPDRVAIARTVRSRGLKGELVAELLTDFPDRFEGLKEVIGVFPDGREESLEIERFWFQKERIVLQFCGVGSLTDAEHLIGIEICVPGSDVVELRENEFFDWQLQECKVSTVEGEDLGRVKEVMRTGAGEILVVEGRAKEYLVPFVEAICVSVEFAEKKIVVDPPDGLLDL